MLFIYLIFVYFVTVSTNGSSKSKHAETIDALILQLHEEHWSEEETLCLENTVELLENVKNNTLWATWVWNANSIPSGNLYGSWLQYGNFDQCVKPPWLHTHPQFRTQYCFADILLAGSPKKDVIDPLSPTEKFLNTPTTLGLPINRLIWGVCMPDSCRPLSIAKITKILYLRTNYETSGFNVTVSLCQVAGAKQSLTAGFYLFFILIAALVLVALGSTYYQRYVANDDHPPDSIEYIVTKAFCVKKNYQDLIKENSHEIKVLNGMRFINASVIVCLHEIFFGAMIGINNSRDMELDAQESASSAVLFHSDLVVDTFLAMSGLLHIKGLLSNSARQQNLFMVLWKRYLRLIGPFAITIFYTTAVATHTSNGPLWPIFNDLEAKVCAKSWRLSLLMLNTDPKDLCHSVTWYISCDYQLAILGTVLFYFYQKDRRLGWAAFATAAVFSLIIPGVLTYWHQLPAIHFLDFGKILFYNVRQYWEISYTYTASYSRAGAYLAGVAMGYLMTLYKPAEHRNIVSKSWSIIGTIISLLAMVAMLSLGQFYIGREYFPIESAIVAALNRVVWAVAVCCIIGLCEYGNLPLINKILGMSIFTPLSRLTYGIYVIHPLLIQRNKFVSRSTIKYDDMNIITNVIGVMTLSIGISFLMWLLVEAPMINLSNRLLFTKSTSVEPPKVTQENGNQNLNGHTKTKAL